MSKRTNFSSYTLLSERTAAAAQSQVCNPQNHQKYKFPHWPTFLGSSTLQHTAAPVPRQKAAEKSTRKNFPSQTLLQFKAGCTLQTRHPPKKITQNTKAHYFFATFLAPPTLQHHQAPLPREKARKKAQRNTFSSQPLLVKPLATGKQPALFSPVANRTTLAA